MPDRRRVSMCLLLAGLTGALALLGGTLAVLSRDLPEQTREPLHFSAANLKILMGSGNWENDRLVVDGYTDSYALLSSGPIRVSTETFRFVTLTLETPRDAVQATLFWRRSDSPQDLLRQVIKDRGSVLIDFSVSSGWSGEISELGILLESSAGEKAAIGNLILQPDGLALRVRSMWNGWVAFEGWSQKSINFLWGGAADQEIPLPVLVGSWVVVTLALFWLYSSISGTRSRQFLSTFAVAVFLAGWMILDLRFTANQSRQAARTIDAFWGADEDERLTRGPDGEIYRYVRRLKQEVLPERPCRILILGDTASEYFLLRAKYHLLPHSTLVTRNIQAPLPPESVDYVIYLGQPEAIVEISGWDDQWRAAMTVVDADANGLVYRTRER